GMVDEEHESMKVGYGMVDEEHESMKVSYDMVDEEHESMKVGYGFYPLAVLLTYIIQKLFDRWAL
ncbi:hypothetical protein AVEN_188344-1, partial [Araneus ventricosus]